MTNDTVAWPMGPKIRSVNRLYQGTPNLPILMHFYINNQVRANNQNIFPGIVSVTAFVSALPFFAYS